jgi:hypothetical protein
MAYQVRGFRFEAGGRVGRTQKVCMLYSRGSTFIRTLHNLFGKPFLDTISLIENKTEDGLQNIVGNVISISMKHIYTSSITERPFI